MNQNRLGRKALRFERILHRKLFECQKHYHLRESVLQKVLFASASRSIMKRTARAARCEQRGGVGEGEAELPVR